MSKEKVAKKEVDVKAEMKRMIEEEGKSRYAVIKELASLDVPVAEIAKAGAEYNISYQYAYNVARTIGKAVTTQRTENKSAKIRELLTEGMKPMQIAKELGLRPQFVYNVRRQMIDRGQLVVEQKQ